MKGRRWALAKASAAMGDESVRMALPIDMKKPKVAPDPAIYCPRVLMMPFVPAPYLKMFTVPNIKPIITPTAAQ